MFKQLGSVLWMASLLVGCGSLEPKLEDEASFEASSEQGICGIGCPSGQYPTRFYCNLACSTNCVSPNATDCSAIPMCGSISTCGIGCPTGYSSTGTYCNLSCGSSCVSHNATRCMRTCPEQPCPNLPSGSVVDSGSAGGLRYFELYYSSFTSVNPSIGTASFTHLNCFNGFTVGQISCNGSPVSATVTYSDTQQINIAIPTSGVARNCVAYSSSTNTQYIRFDFVAPAN
ncbi:hypothetical protein ACN469_42365 [Corallococcus terminator]